MKEGRRAWRNEGRKETAIYEGRKEGKKDYMTEWMDGRQHKPDNEYHIFRAHM